MSTGRLAVFAAVVGLYCVISVGAGFWLAWRNYH